MPFEDRDVSAIRSPPSSRGRDIFPKLKAKQISTTIHDIIEESFNQDAGVATVTTETDIAEPTLLQAVTGHLVNGLPLCSSSIYADMALTVANYLYKGLKPDSTKADMNVCNMEVEKPLIAQGKGSRLLKIRATANMGNRRTELFFSTTARDGKQNTEHGKCYVEYGDNEVWLADWARYQHLVKSRVNHLVDASVGMGLTKVHRGIAYKLFASFVNYQDRFRGMEEVIMDSQALEATAQVKFQATDRDGDFYFSPYWVDSLAHVSGFIINANDAINSTKEVYISHGWESMRFAMPFSAEKTYRSCVKMLPAKDKMVAGDVYVFEDDRIVDLVVA